MKNNGWAVMRLAAAIVLAFLTSTLAMDAPPYQLAQVASPVAPLSEGRCHVRGLEAEVRCVRIQVPRDWQTPDGEQLDISAAIVPSTAATPEPDPLVVLAGGPGQAATDYGAMVYTAFHEVRKQRDIILFDQRGTGHSSILRCPPLSPWQYDEASVRGWARACAGTVRHTHLYSMPQVVEDLEALRRALRLERINLWGVSYGTLTAQQYMRRYEKHVRSAVLDGALTPDRRLLQSAGPDADAQLQALFRECAAWPACDARYPQLQRAFTRLLDDLKRRPAPAVVKRPLSAEVRHVRLTRDAVVLMIRDALYSGRTRAILPYAIDEATHGRWDILLAMDSEMNTGTARAMAWGATLSVLCADQTESGDARAHDATAFVDGFTGDSFRRFWQTACANWPHAMTAPSLRTALRSRVPVLILSGGLDPITPPASGAAVAAQFKSALHAIAPDAAHNVSDLGCAPTVLRNFIDSASTTNTDVACLGAYRRPNLFVGRRLL
jgi:pimeloyl-ACP methyl ester carboxylesterase